jgi:hypothetical protein
MTRCDACAHMPARRADTRVGHMVHARPGLVLLLIIIRPCSFAGLTGSGPVAWLVIDHFAQSGRRSRRNPPSRIWPGAGPRKSQRTREAEGRFGPSAPGVRQLPYCLTVPGCRPAPGPSRSAHEQAGSVSTLLYT